jgi:peptidoglycan-N-acetylglucosamine deacetylase
MASRVAALSVDLDEVPNYFAIHGLGPLDSTSGGPRAHLGYDVALLRLASFADAHAIPLTLFAIGQDLARADNTLALRALARRGHAVENHSLSHRYDFARASKREILEEIDAGARAIFAATGERPRGFRAPGYTVNDRVFDALEELGVAWDSSVFPCPAYYGLKALALGWIRLRGRRSRSVLDTPWVIAAPTRPYRPGKPWHRRGARALVELPIQVTPKLRVPFIGTTIGLSGARAGELASRCLGEPVINIELHLMDFLDRADGLDDLAEHQPELRVPLADRLRALEAVVEILKKAGYAFVRVDEAARRV